MTNFLVLAAAALLSSCLVTGRAAAEPVLTPNSKPIVPLAEYTVQRTRGAITIDGVLDEKSWKNATPTQEWRFLDGVTKATFATTAKMLWDDDCLYLAFSIADTNVRAKRTQRDDDVFNEDCVEFFIMEQNRKDQYHHFLEYEVSPNNTQFDAYNLAPLEGIVNWDSKGWRSAVKVDGTLNNSSDTDKGWTVEMAIPFFDLYGSPFRTAEVAKAMTRENKQYHPNPGDRWRANLYRISRVNKRHEWMAWSPTLSTGFHFPERFGTLVFSREPAGSQKDSAGVQDVNCDTQ